MCCEYSLYKVRNCTHNKCIVIMSEPSYVSYNVPPKLLIGKLKLLFRKFAMCLNNSGTEII